MQKVKLVADTLTLMALTTIVGLIAEVFFLGYSFGFSAQLRLGSLPFNALAGRPYGIWRDACLRIFRAEKTFILEILADSFAMTTFHTPLYITLAKLLAWLPWQVSPPAITDNTLAILIAFACSGYPYGLILDRARQKTKATRDKLFG